MQLLSAASLWWLLPLAGVILALYLLKMRRRDLRVPAVFLWPKLTADVRANAPIQRLRISLLLILQLLVVALLVAGMAQPVRRARGLVGRATVVVLDASAGMSATDVAPSRFEAARRQIESLIAGMSAGDRLALVEAEPLTRVIFPMTGDKARMRAALADLSPTDAPANMGEALRLAAALVGQEHEGRIVILSDGDFPHVADFSAGRAQVQYEPIGRSARNLGIVAFDSALLSNGDTQLFAGIHNYDSASMSATLTFTVDGQLADARRITVPAGQTLGQTLSIPGGARRAQAQIEAPGDLLKADDTASLYLQGEGTVRTLLVTPGDLFLERALSLEPSIQLDRSAEVPPAERAGTPGEGPYDLVVFDGAPAQPVKAPAVLSFGSASPDMPVSASGLATRPRVISWDRQSTILQDADLTNLLIQKASNVQLKPGGHAIAVGSGGPLIVASDSGGRRTIYVAWSLLDSDFPLRVCFPIFVDDAVGWLTGQGGANHGGSVPSRLAKGGLNIRAGQSFSVPVPTGAGSLTLVGPGGSRQSIPVIGGMSTVRAADRVGDYTLAGEGLRVPISVNLLDQDAGDIAPRPALDLSGHPVAGSPYAAISLADIWRPLALLALVVLGLEWWVFVRKS